MAFVYLHYLTIISTFVPVLLLIVFKPLNTIANESSNSPYNLIAMMANSYHKNMNRETDEINAIHCTYSQARRIRTINGHDAALPFYQSLLQRNKKDFSAAVRIAASSLSPSRHDGACPSPGDRLHCTSNASSNITANRILELRTLLARSRYDNKHVQNMFGIRHDNAVDTPSGNDGVSQKMNRLAFARGPVYIKPVSAGNGEENTCTPIDRYLSSLQENDEDDEVTRIEASFQCLVTLFLLGFSVPKEILLQHLFGGQKTIELLEQLGLAYPCELDPGIIVPYVHIFPLDIDIIPKQSTCRTATGTAIAVDNNHDVPFMSTSTTSGETYEGNEQLKDDDNSEPRRKCILLVTDCHPTILSRTTVGTENDGAVMYIGPDSLALVQHIPLKYHIEYLQQHGLLSKKNQYSSSSAPSSPSLSILDFCTGSGVQAISTLIALEEVSPDAKAVCVDVNDRALRFAKFNSLLNGIEDERLQTIKADLICGKLLDMSKESATGEDNKKMEDLKSTQKGNMEKLINTLLQVAGDGVNGPMSYYDIILANPPFIPVPPLHKENNQVSAFIHDNKEEMLEEDTMIRQSIAKRYGLFSSGGSNGEEVLRSIITMSSRLLRKEGGLLAIVSEFMNPPTMNTENNDNKLHVNLNEEFDDELYRKIKRWWENPSFSNVKIKNNEDEKVCRSNYESKGILFTNQYPVDANTYAYRRADNKHECEVWSQHLDLLGIHSVSPGLMYIQTLGEKQYPTASSEGVESGKGGNLDLECHLVPKSDSGSVWTPYNERGVFFTRSEWTKIINKCE